MEIVCYLPVSPYCTEILQRLRLSLPFTALETFESLAPFLRRLLRPSRLDTCLLIIPADHTDLDCLLDNVELLRDMPLVLVAPDPFSQTLAKSHRLRPRFLTDRDADPEEVVSVLYRIQERLKRENSPGEEPKGSEGSPRLDRPNLLPHN